MDIININNLLAEGLVTNTFTADDFLIIVKKDLTPGGDGYRQFAIPATAFGGSGSQTLAQTLTIGNLTGEQLITSDNGFSTLSVLNVSNQMLFNDGFGGFGSVKIGSIRTIIEHALQNRFDAPDNNFPQETASRLAYFDASKNLKPIVLGTDLTLTGNVLNSKFTGNTLGTCIADIFVTNIHSCSPLHIQPTNTGDVYINEAGGKVGVGLITPLLTFSVKPTANLDGIILQEDATNFYGHLGKDGTKGFLFLYDGGSAKVALNGPSYSTGIDYINTGLNLGIGLNAAAAKVHIYGSTSLGEQLLTLTTTTGFWDIFSVGQGTITSRVNNFVMYGSGVPGTGTNPTLTLHDEVGVNPLISFYSDIFAATTLAILGSNIPRISAPNTSRLWFDSNVGVGLIATLDTRLYVQGTSATSADYALKVENIAGSPLLYVRNDGNVYAFGVGSVVTNTSFGLNNLLNNTTGDFNTVYGVEAMRSNTIGRLNVAIGHSAMRNATGTSDYNVAIGYQTLMGLTASTSNVAIGYQALMSATTGSQNTAIGFQALRLDTLGFNNTAFGHSSLLNNLIGNNNSGYGVETLKNTNADNNTALGSAAGRDNVSGTGSVFIGYNAGLNELTSNKLYIANTGTVNPLIYGDFGTSYLKFNATIINVAGLQTGNAGLVSGDQYVDSAANILANGDQVVGRKV